MKINNYLYQRASKFFYQIANKFFLSKLFIPIIIIIFLIQIYLSVCGQNLKMRDNFFKDWKMHEEIRGDTVYQYYSAIDVKNGVPLILDTLIVSLLPYSWNEYKKLCLPKDCIIIQPYVDDPFYYVVKFKRIVHSDSVENVAKPRIFEGGKIGDGDELNPSKPIHIFRPKQKFGFEPEQKLDVPAIPIPDTIGSSIKEVIIPYSEKNGRRYFKDYYMTLPDTVTKYKYGIWNDIDNSTSEMIYEFPLSIRIDSLEKRIEELEEIIKRNILNEPMVILDTTLKSIEEYQKEYEEWYFREDKYEIKSGVACPECGAELIKHLGFIYDSNPPMYNTSCPKCDYKGYLY